MKGYTLIYAMFSLTIFKYIWYICYSTINIYLLWWLFTLGKGPEYGKYGPADLSKADFVIDNRMYPHLVSIPYPSSVHW